MRQAVVLIHGIGEQRPMATLRRFVQAVLSEDAAGPSSYRSKPDRLSESYELRRLVADGTRNRPPTDFFEYYWAHHMEGNTVGHLWPLARLILIRFPWNVPPPLRALWLLTWTLFGAAAGAWIWFLRTNSTEALPVFATLTTIALGLVQVVLAKYLGDAARYLSPVPENVGIRQKIRADGIDVLRRIHHSKTYDRIIIVGHSLGSVIGYDMITHLWDETNEVHASLDRPRQEVLKKVEQLGRKLTVASKEDLIKFRDLQRQLWLEQRLLGNPWLVSDFITLGSPLTYGATLFARNDAEFQQRQEDRELPRCPPVTDAGKYAYRSETYRVNGAERNLRVLHHAAAFAVTRWTNVFVPVRAGLLGDWIGGPLRTAFGPGIVDVDLPGASGANLPLVAHTRYWTGGQKSPGLVALTQALALNSREWLPRRGAVTAPINVVPAPNAVPPAAST